MTALLLLLTMLLATAAGNFSPTIHRLSLPSCNEVTLECKVQTPEGIPVSVENSQFFADDNNIQDLLPDTEFDSSVEGVIRFTLRQNLEAHYTCRNNTYTSTNSIPLITCPTRDSVDRYHAVAAGQEVSLECGVKQGALASYYHPVWKKGFTTVDTTSPGSLYRLQREELEDFTLTFLNPFLSDSGMYFCDVETEQENGMVPVEEGGRIELLVYERPVITHMTGDIIAIIRSEELENVTFTCNATGSPDLTVSWYHNGERVTSSEKYSVQLTSTNSAVSSRIVLSNPKLTDSGTMTCEAGISFRTDTGTDNRSTETSLTETTRNIVILDTSPSVTVTVTQDSDLLVRISLRDTVLLQPVKLFLKFTSQETGEAFSYRPDSKYSDSSIIYHFIPASKIPDSYRRFWVQAALIVDDEVGPYNPPALTAPLVTDLDNVPSECEQTSSLSTTHIIIIAVAAASSVVIIVTVIGVIVAVVKRHKHNQIHDEKLKRIEEEHSANKREEIRKARNDVLEILPLIPENSEIMNLLKRDLEDWKSGIMADDGEEVPEVDRQKALKDYIERLKRIKDTEPFTLRLEELYRKVTTNDHPVGTATNDGGSGEKYANGSQRQEVESTV